MHTWLNSNFDKYLIKPFAPRLAFTTHTCYEDYCDHASNQHAAASYRARVEAKLLPANPVDFSVRGYCRVCLSDVNFAVDFLYADTKQDPPIPNWRERLICPLCQLNNRTRAAIDIFQQTCKSSKRSRIYLTEQLTPLYQWFSARFPQAIGSEFLGDQIQLGQCNEQGIRNEDLTQLSFADNELDSILSFDVLEHVPDYMQALSECLRSLKPGGVLLLSVPFSQVSADNIIRAYHDENGELHHLLPPDYHGDPVNPDGGCLCYYYFGWSLLDDLRAQGYCDVQALFYWSEKYAYLGGEQILLVAKKPE